jgi:transposase InsO family protein
MFNKDEKYKILKHLWRFGIASCIDAFGVSRATVYRWQKKYTEGHYSTDNLKDKSRKPRHYKRSTVDTRIIRYIQKERLLHLGIGKRKLRALIEKYCNDNQIECVSEATIGRIIKRLKESHSIPLLKPSTKITLNGATGKLHVRIIKKQKKLRRKDYKPQEPGDLVQIDTVEIRLNGVRRFIITAIDLTSRFSFAYAYKSLSSDSARDFLEKLIEVAPFEITHIQTDNGLEFHKHFQECCNRHNITHFYNYPRTPKMNAYVERFNRTIQEEFVSQHYWNLKDNIEEFNREMKLYLEWYNGVRPHEGLDYKSPVCFMLGEFSDLGTGNFN